MDKETINLICDATGIADVWIPAFLRAKFKCELCGKSALESKESIIGADKWCFSLTTTLHEGHTIKGAYAVICPRCHEHINIPDDKSYIFKKDIAALRKYDKTARRRIINGLRMMVERTIKKRLQKVNAAQPILQQLTSDPAYAKDCWKSIQAEYRDLL
ncbi:MAG: hypothetical protein Q7R35_06255 [Elusimicrobiota bacterium]|nr:hypothetical protein [Elusimicrobiota bacterium]